MRDHSTDYVEFTLPLPPTINHYYGDRVISKGGKNIVMKYVTKAGKDFQLAVKEIVKSELKRCKELFYTDKTGLVKWHKLPRIQASCSMRCKDYIRRDIDNFCGKALYDALCKAGAYIDDSQIDAKSYVRTISKSYEKNHIVIRLRRI